MQIRRFILVSLIISMALPLCASDDSEPSKVRPVATYSIVARDPATGEIGVAVQSHWFSVGSLVTWAKAGVGAVATQSFVLVDYGPNGLKLMEEGATATAALRQTIAADEGQAVRQVAMIDVNGDVNNHTGLMCIDEAGGMVGRNYAVQANMMLSNQVWSRMAGAFEGTEGPLAERMIAALEAAESVGGDVRGRQSAAIKIVSGKKQDAPWKGVLMELRVEDHTDPVGELKRLVRVARAYEHMNAGDLAVEHGDNEGALREYSAAGEMFPDNLEMKFWHAVGLVNMGRIKESYPMFLEIIKADKNWRILLQRLDDVNLMKEEDVKAIVRKARKIK